VAQAKPYIYVYIQTCIRKMI